MLNYDSSITLKTKHANIRCICVSLPANSSQLESIVRKLLNTSGPVYFIFICLATFFLLFMKKNLVEAEIVAFEILAQEGEMGFIQAVNTLQYMTIPLYYGWVFTLSGFIIWVGCFMFGYRVTYGQCWKIVMIASTVFLLAELIKIIHFLGIQEDITLDQIRAYYPLSIMSLFNAEAVPDQYLYPFNALNLFEVTSWVVMVYGVHVAADKRFNISVYIVGFSYVLFFLIWLGFYTMIYK